MKTIEEVSSMGCGCCGLSRRQFLAGCAACAAGAAGLAGVVPQRVRAAEGGGAKPRVRLIFSHTSSDGPIWPYQGYDFEPRKKELREKLTNGCPGVELLPVTVANAAEAGKLLNEDKDIDGYVVCLESCWTGVPMAIAASGRPTIIADDLYCGSGEFLIANAAARRQRLKAAAVSSARIEDLIEAVRCFEVLKRPGGSVDAFVDACNAVRMKNTPPAGNVACTPDAVTTVSPAEVKARLRESRVVDIGAGVGDLGKAIKEIFGVEVVPVDFKELHTAYEQADRAEAAKCADRWIAGAEKVIEPNRDEIIRSGAMYLAMCEVMKRHKADAITINCLGGFYGGHIKAYPCLGHRELNDCGKVGACEADLVSTITMLTMGHLTGRPGFISDPIIDTSKNQIIYAHCVAPTKVFGPQGAANPYHIRSHSEDRKGAVVRSLMPLGYMTTTIEFHPLYKKVILHQGKTMENVDDEKACRSKLAVEVKGSIEKLMNEWDQWGWHRVTYYGDLKEQVKQMADALGMTVLEEA